jgi:hypothetical protein
MKWPAAAAFAVASLLLAGAARAHVVYGTETLRGLVVQADLVARVRILDPGALGSAGGSDPRAPGTASSGADAALGEPVVVAEILELIKGAPAPAATPGASPTSLRFVQHGHGVPLYAKNQETVIFLQKLERTRELSALAGKIAWVSIQEGKALPGDARLMAALRAYAALEKLPLAQQPQGLRQITVKLLASPDPMLASSAVRDVALLSGAPIVTAEDLPALEPVLWNDKTPIGVRVALLSELERRGLVEGPPRWVKLLRETHGSDQIAVVRAVAAHSSAAITHELVSLLASPDALLVSAAAISLGVPGNEKAVEPLGKLLASSDERVRMAAIRGLGRIGTPAAHASLAQAATSHPDPATRRRAGAEVARRP